MDRSDHLRVLYEQPGLPIFQNRVYETLSEAQSCPRGDIKLVENQRTGLVYNTEFRSDLMVYDARYQNEQAVSPSFQRHLESVSQVLERSIGRNGIVEIGCGKGYFLEMLLAKGFDLTGFDPAYEGDNPRVRTQYFEPGVGLTGNSLVLRHVLEHVQNPFGFLQQLKNTNGGSGRIYIEVPCFDWICQRRAWFDIFYEHVNYFRLSDFKRMFGQIIESGRLFGDQYIYVVAELASLKEPVLDPRESVVFPTDFVHTLSKWAELDGRARTVWGGSSKGVVFALLQARAGGAITTMIDINPVKQNKYLPITGLRVESPKKALEHVPTGSTIYVMNSNYLSEIKEMSNNSYMYITVDHD
jgi:hypothetical protein